MTRIIMTARQTNCVSDDKKVWETIGQGVNPGWRGGDGVGGR